MTLKILAAGAALAALVGVHHASAQTAEAPAAPGAEVRREVVVIQGGGPGKMDANGDGEITREEFMAPHGEMFSRMDKNGDGKVTAEEMQAMHPPGGGHRGPGGRDVMIFRGGPQAGGPVWVEGAPGEQRVEVRMMGPGGGHGAMDKDADGFVSRAEFDAAHAEMFGKLDTDKDGRVSDAEMKARHEAMMAGHGPGGPGRMMVMGEPGGDGSHVFIHRRGGEAGEAAGEREVRVVRIERSGGDGMDKNKDGRISMNEFLAPMKEAFREMDADRNGYLDAGEGGHGAAASRGSGD